MSDLALGAPTFTRALESQWHIRTPAMGGILVARFPKKKKILLIVSTQLC